MLIVNGEKLNLTGKPENGTDLEVFVKTKMQELKENYKGRFPLMFLFNDHLKFTKNVSFGMSENFKKVDGYPQGRVLPCETTVIILGDKVKIRYAEEEILNGNAEVIGYEPRKIPFRGKMMIKDHELDKAFYFLYLLGDVEGRIECSEVKLLNVNKGLKTLKHVDEFKISEAEIMFEKTKTRINNFILNELSDEHIKQIAILYSIPKAQDSPSSVLRSKLVKSIASKQLTASPNENEYLSFEKKIKQIRMNYKPVNLETEIRGMIAIAEEREYIKRQDGKVRKGWIYWHPKNKTNAGYIMQSLPPAYSNDFVGALVSLLLTDEDERLRMKEYISKCDKEFQ